MMIYCIFAEAFALSRDEAEEVGRALIARGFTVDIHARRTTEAFPIESPPDKETDIRGQY